MRIVIFTAAIALSATGVPAMAQHISEPPVVAIPIEFVDIMENPATTEMRQEWARVQFQIDDRKMRRDAFRALSERAVASLEQSPDDIELMTWTGIIFASLAGESRGTRALRNAKRARDILLDVEQRENGAPKNPSVLTALGILYHKTPGGALGFGDEKRALAYLERALVIDPDGVDTNYSMAVYLAAKKRYAEAMTFIERGIASPVSGGGGSVAEQGRRKQLDELKWEVEQAMAQAATAKAN